MGSGAAVTGWDLARDPAYARSLAILRDHQSDLKIATVTEHLNEDVSREIFSYYTRLKRWYGYLAAGDRAFTGFDSELVSGTVLPAPQGVFPRYVEPGQEAKRGAAS